MTIEPICYVCGKKEPCIDGLCSDCTMKEFFNPGAAFAVTFGSLPMNKLSEEIARPTDTDFQPCRCDCGCTQQTLFNICLDCKSGDHAGSI